MLDRIDGGDSLIGGPRPLSLRAEGKWGIALTWRGRCIIRPIFLGNIKAAWRRVIVKSAEVGIPMPALSAALAHYDGHRVARLSDNLLQDQPDYFGAHT